MATLGSLDPRFHCPVTVRYLLDVLVLCRAAPYAPSLCTHHLGRQVTQSSKIRQQDHAPRSSPVKSTSKNLEMGRELSKHSYHDRLFRRPLCSVRRGEGPAHT